MCFVRGWLTRFLLARGVVCVSDGLLLRLRRTAARCAAALAV